MKHKTLNILMTIFWIGIGVFAILQFTNIFISNQHLHTVSLGIAAIAVIAIVIYISIEKLPCKKTKNEK